MGGGQTGLINREHPLIQGLARHADKSTSGVAPADPFGHPREAIKNRTAQESKVRIGSCTGAIYTHARAQASL